MMTLSVNIDYLGEIDARIINQTTVVIGPLSEFACVTIEAIGDEIAEETEIFNLTAMVINTLDSVNGTTNIEIPANDGIYVTTEIKKDSANLSPIIMNSYSQVL